MALAAAGGRARACAGRRRGADAAATWRGTDSITIRIHKVISITLQDISCGLKKITKLCFAGLIKLIHGKIPKPFTNDRYRR